METLYLGGLISLAVRLGILLVASLVLFWRSNRLKLPQINLYRVGLNCLTISITAVYWIFYSYKVREITEKNMCVRNLENQIFGDSHQHCHQNGHRCHRCENLILNSGTLGRKNKIKFRFYIGTITRTDQ